MPPLQSLLTGARASHWGELIVRSGAVLLVRVAGVGGGDFGHRCTLAMP